MEIETLFNILSNEVRIIKNSKQVEQIAKKYFRVLPETTEAKFYFFELLAESKDVKLFTFITIWIKRIQLYDIEYFNDYEKWLFLYVDTWGKCDVFCYRILNPMIETHPSLFNKIKAWTSSQKPYVKRASAVCMIHSSTNFSVRVAFHFVEEVSSALLDDKHIHVQKGIGWLLKYAYLTYPKEVIDYLQNNVNRMSRTTYRYALEKMPYDLKQKMMFIR